MKTFSMVKNVFRFDLDCFNPEFTDNHLLVWVYLQRFSTYREINFCMGWLFDDLNINYRDTQKDLIKALFDLIEWELVKPIEDITKINRNTRIKLKAIKYDDNFTKLLDSEIDKILYSDEDIRVKKTMLYIYTLIVSRIDEKGYCFPRIETFKKDMQIIDDDENTIPNNNRIIDARNKLKELGLIDFAKAGIIKDAKGRIYNANNIYVTTYTENYREILQNAVNSNREYHENNNSIVMQKKKKEDVSIPAEENNIEIDEKVLNFDYQNDFSLMKLKHVKMGLEGKFDKEHTFQLYEELKKCYDEEIEYREKVRKTEEHRKTLNVSSLPIQIQKKEKEDDTLDWLKEVEEKEKFYAEFENNKEEKTILEVLNENKDCEKYELPF